MNYNLTMNFAEGVALMKRLAEELKAAGKTTSSFASGPLLITYPGYKAAGDYKLTENGTAPKHTDIVSMIYTVVTNENIVLVIEFLDDVYTNGLAATSTVFPRSFIEKLFWITLQEEINYPQPARAGRKLPFQRFYEAVLAKTGITDIQTVLVRTNNHGKKRPELFDTKQLRRPLFYQ